MMPATVAEQRIRGRRSDRKPRTKAKATEPQLWAALEPTAKASFAFWNSFIALRMGPQNDQLLTESAKKQWLCIIRAVSWVESKHGTVGQSHPFEDPMQCGNPRDTWWRELTNQIPQGQQDRIICGPNRPNFFAGELPPAAEKVAELPDSAKLSLMDNAKAGHKDSKFTYVMSLYWAVPFLLHKSNSPVDGATFKCGDCSRQRLVRGAVAYNGGGDPKYEEKINAALDMIGCMKAIELEIPALAEVEFKRESVEIFDGVLRALREHSAGDSANRLFFPNGINLVDVQIRIGSASLGIKVSGATSANVVRPEEGAAMTLSDDQ